MTAQRTNVVTEGTARKFARGLLFVLSVASPLAWGDVALYQAAVPLKGTAEADRAAAFGEALRIAAVRASGRRDAGSVAAIAAAAAAPARYVQQYSTTADRMLKVGFDGRAMEQLLQQAGLPLWPSERPTTTVFLFVPTIAGGARAVTAAERPPERREIEWAAQLRGVPVTWPAAPVDADTARARATSAGVTGAVLLGTAGAGGYEWVFGHAGQSAKGKGGPAAGLGLAADTLAARYAPGSTRGLSTTTVRIGGLEDVRSYAALTTYLDGLSLVRSVSLRELSGSTALFDLGVRGDLELLRRIFALDGRLAPAPRTEAATARQESPDFVWQP
ncbi:MAG: DUF2066 domain-containing protein [Gammaproteobacteria bacterium]|nr:DUF2066 domain-containing protein [Gammaproteobacteria bacterium]MDH5271858.1 DUF2066 domain-containing protein [Gammaproteobacteria bacterium]